MTGESAAEPNPPTPDPEPPGPAVSGPAVSGPAVSGPAVSGPAVSGPAVSGPAVSGPAVSGPEVPDPAGPGAAMPGPAAPGAAVSGPAMSDPAAQSTPAPGSAGAAPDTARPGHEAAERVSESTQPDRAVVGPVPEETAPVTDASVPAAEAPVVREAAAAPPSDNAAAVVPTDAEPDTATVIPNPGHGASPATDRSGVSAGPPTRIRRVALPDRDRPAGPCTGCRAEHYDHTGSCVGCGMPSPRQDRFEADLGTVCVVTDRGLVHEHNEDSVAVAVLDSTVPGEPGVTVIVVCDGVSTSEDPQAASGAAARAGVAANLAALGAGATLEEATLAGLSAAAKAVRAVGTPEGRAPSCTYLSAVLVPDPNGTRITVASVGDSRAYWLTPTAPTVPSAPTVRAAAATPAVPTADTAHADDSAPGVPAPPGVPAASGAAGSPGAAALAGSRRLTDDDSLAQDFIKISGVDERTAMSMRGAHTLTRWLGADIGTTPWADDCVRSLYATGPGALLLCSDGLWNYLPEAEALGDCTFGPAGATGPVGLSEARALVDFAIRQGGSDNITVALAPVPGRAQPSPMMCAYPSR